MLENIWAVESLFSKYMLSRMSERRGLPETLMKHPDLGTGITVEEEWQENILVTSNCKLLSAVSLPCCFFFFLVVSFC